MNNRRNGTGNGDEFPFPFIKRPWPYAVFFIIQLLFFILAKFILDSQEWKSFHSLSRKAKSIDLRFLGEVTFVVRKMLKVQKGIEIRN
jgi:hypothetical protein